MHFFVFQASVVAVEEVIVIVENQWVTGITRTTVWLVVEAVAPFIEVEVLKQFFFIMLTVPKYLEYFDANYKIIRHILEYIHNMLVSIIIS